MTVTLTATSPTGVIAYGKNPKIRRWDQTDPTATNGVLTATTPVDLENGVQVTFGGPMLYAGDYWMIPARTAINEETGTLDYPATAQTASYSAHNLCSLAVITFDPTAGWGTPTDCRIPFPPLTGLPKASGGGCCTTVTVGDGKTSTGQYTDIGTAIAGLPSSGGVVGIEAGSYTIATPIVVPDGVTLRGCPGQTIILADAGAFIVEGDEVTVSGISFEIGTAAAVATRPGAGVSDLSLIDNIVLSRTHGKTGTAPYAFSFSADTANVARNTLRLCGIEVQPDSANVSILANKIVDASGRGISIGSQSAAAPATTASTGSFSYYGFASVSDIDKTAAIGGTTVTSSIVATIDIAENTITGAALEGIAAESVIEQTNGDGTAVAQQIFGCEDVSISGNRISRCLARANETKVVASAAVLFPIVERFTVVRNTIDDNGLTIAASGIGSAIALGSEIRENRILQNGSGAVAEATYGMAAIELLIAMPASPNPTAGTADIALPAAIISDNIVTNRNAPCLFMLADGQVSITNNDFTSVGYSDNAIASGQCVVVMDLGSGAQEALALSDTSTGSSQTNLGSAQAPAYSADAEVTGGQVLFAGNRCLYDGRDTAEAPKSSILLLSDDALIVEGNQSRCFVLASSQSGSAGTLSTNLLGLALVAQVSGNRFSEDSASASALVLGADTIGIGNHGTHCLFFVGTQTQVDAPNIVNAGFSANCAAVGRAVFGK